MKRSTFAVIAAVAALITLPLDAQICVGIPTHDGQLHLAGVGTTGGPAAGYGLEFGANFAGYLSSAFGYTRGSDDDGDTDRFSARLAYEIPMVLPQACPMVGVSLARLGDDSERLIVPIGVGIGSPILYAGRMEVGLHAIPRYLWVQDRVADARDRHDGFGAELGGSVSLGRVFFGGGVSVDTLEGSDTEGIFRIGVSF